MPLVIGSNKSALTDHVNVKTSGFGASNYAAGIHFLLSCVSIVSLNGVRLLLDDFRYTKRSHTSYMLDDFCWLRVSKLGVSRGSCQQRKKPTRTHRTISLTLPPVGIL